MIDRTGFARTSGGVPTVGRIAVAVVVGALTCLAGPAAAQDRFASVEPGVGDAAFLGVVVPIDLGLLFVDPARTERDGPAWVVDRHVADALVWQEPRAASVTSDWLLWSFVLAQVAGPVIGTASFDRDARAGALVGIEALAMTQLVTGLVKHTVRRERPGGEAEHGDSAWASFPSGHTSMAFAGATMLTIYAHEYGWGDDHEWALPVVAYTLAAFTGYLRVAGHRHWMTDVSAGALVGTGTTYLTYVVRTAQRGERRGALAWVDRGVGRRRMR